jgi:hypothetical protein
MSARIVADGAMKSAQRAPSGNVRGRLDARAVMDAPTSDAETVITQVELLARTPKVMPMSR